MSRCHCFASNTIAECKQTYHDRCGGLLLLGEQVQRIPSIHCADHRHIRLGSPEDASIRDQAKVIYAPKLAYLGNVALLLCISVFV
jgi:hypothetical protein